MLKLNWRTSRTAVISAIVIIWEAVSFGLPIAFDTIPNQLGFLSMAMGLAAGLVAILLPVRPPNKSTRTKKDRITKLGDQFNNYGINHGHIGNNIFGKPKRDFFSPAFEPARKQLDALPKSKKIVVMTIMGDAESHQLGAQVLEYLESKNANLSPGGLAQGVFTKPVHGLILEEHPDEIKLVVGHQN